MAWRAKVAGLGRSPGETECFPITVQSGRAHQKGKRAFPIHLASLPQMQIVSLPVLLRSASRCDLVHDCDHTASQRSIPQRTIALSILSPTSYTVSVCSACINPLAPPPSFSA